MTMLSSAPGSTVDLPREGHAADDTVLREAGELPVAVQQHSGAVARESMLLSPRFLILAALGFGVVLRLLQYAVNRSLWLDEALVLPSIIGRPLAELLNPGTWGALPPGFLFLSRLSTIVLGSSEYALRLVPLLAGLASMFLFLAVARRYVSAHALPLAMVLFALSPFLIYYASDVKQYSSDAAVTLLLLLVAFELRARGITAKRAVAWCLIGLAAAGMSMTALFVLIGVTGAMLVESIWRRDRRSAVALAAVVGAWALAFGVPYLLFVQGAGRNEYLQAFWISGFMPFPPQSLSDLSWFPSTFARLFRDPLGVFDDAAIARGYYQSAAGMLVFTAGVVWMVLRRRALLLMLLAPVAVTLVASGMRLYPFGGTGVTEGRVLLFLVPVFLLVMAEGAMQLHRRLGGRLKVVSIAVIALLILPPLAQALIAIPYGRIEIKPVLGYVQENWQPGDVMYVHYEVQHEFAYYAPRYDFQAGDFVIGPCARFEPTRYLDALSTHLGQPRLWVLFGSGVGPHEAYERRLMLDFLDHFGTRVDDQVALGSAVYLYDLRPTGEVKPNFTFRPLGFGYVREAGCAIWGGD
ncbi:hypothetical protein BH24GEM3_BH24GEM3_08660 [soil metagenome]